jgi:acetoin utilization protein AcuC
MLWVGELLVPFHHGQAHPNAIDRQEVFVDEARRQGLLDRVAIGLPRAATREELLRFHDEAHVNWVRHCSLEGTGQLGDEDTLAYSGVYEDAAARVGTALEAAARLMDGTARRCFQPVGGTHHARRHRGGGFGPFSDIGVVIESLRAHYGVRRIAYADIDAHHGDGVYDAYQHDPHLAIADIHQDGATLFPGTGSAQDTGHGPAAGSKLNLPLAPGATDGQFQAAWARAQAHLEALKPEFVILQCGADSLAGDPLADLCFTAACHEHAARQLCALADRHARGRLLVLGGGGYAAANVAAAWTGVLRALLA